MLFSIPNWNIQMWCHVDTCAHTHVMLRIKLLFMISFINPRLYLRLHIDSNELITGKVRVLCCTRTFYQFYNKIILKCCNNVVFFFWFAVKAQIPLFKPEKGYGAGLRYRIRNVYSSLPPSLNIEVLFKKSSLVRTFVWIYMVRRVVVWWFRFIECFEWFLKKRMNRGTFVFVWNYRNDLFSLLLFLPSPVKIKFQFIIIFSIPLPLPLSFSNS